jgi:hypothetical protein
MKSRRELPVLIVQDGFGLSLRQRRGPARISRNAFAEHGMKERHLRPMASVFAPVPVALPRLLYSPLAHY